MQLKNIPKFSDHFPIFVEVIAKKNIKQTDKFTTCGLRKSLEWDHCETKIFQANKKKIKIRAFFEKNIRKQTLNIYIYIYINSI